LYIVGPDDYDTSYLVYLLTVTYLFVHKRKCWAMHAPFLKGAVSGVMLFPKRIKQVANADGGKTSKQGRALLGLPPPPSMKTQRKPSQVEHVLAPENATGPNACTHSTLLICEPSPVLLPIFFLVHHTNPPHRSFQPPHPPSRTDSLQILS